mmetsp:Transcript_87566/g.252853  ORF Transcript_87566/g.252853 Transcript_87566/m.252853 type:complete len:314 (+) Transcript_87566:477-1418(+)
MSSFASSRSMTSSAPAGSMTSSVLHDDGSPWMTSSAMMSDATCCSKSDTTTCRRGSSATLSTMAMASMVASDRACSCGSSRSRLSVVKRGLATGGLPRPVSFAPSAINSMRTLVMIFASAKSKKLLLSTSAIKKISSTCGARSSSRGTLCLTAECWNARRSSPRSILSSKFRSTRSNMRRTSLERGCRRAAGPPCTPRPTRPSSTSCVNSTTSSAIKLPLPSTSASTNISSKKVNTSGSASFWGAAADWRATVRYSFRSITPSRFRSSFSNAAAIGSACASSAEAHSKVASRSAHRGRCRRNREVATKRRLSK